MPLFSLVGFTTEQEVGPQRWLAVEVVHGLVQNMNAIIDGEQMYSTCHRPSVDFGSFQTTSNLLMVSGKH